MILAASAATLLIAAAPANIGESDGALEALRGAGPSTPDAARAIETRLRAAAEREPEEARWRVGLALAAAAGHDFDAARAHAEKAVELEPDVARHHYLVGLYALRRLERQETAALARAARDALQTAIELQPDHIDARMLLGCYYAAAPGLVGGSFDRAAEQAQALDAIDGGAFAAHVVRARIAAERTNWTDMRRHCDLAEDVAPSRRHVYALRIRQAETTLREINQPAEALGLLNDLPPTDLDEDAAARLRLRGVILQSLGHLHEAVGQYRQALDRLPRDAASSFHLAECYAELGEPALALRWYESTLEIDPDHEQARQVRRAIDRMRRLAQVE